MNIFFNRKHSYYFSLPIHQVQYKLKALVTRRFEDHSVDVIGYLNRDGTFRLTNKWSITNINWVQNRTAYIEGTLLQKNDDTIVQINIRPNIILVILFYIALVFAMVEMCGIENFIDLPNYLKISSIFLLNIIIGSLIFFFSQKIKKSFERLMQVK